MLSLRRNETVRACFFLSLSQSLVVILDRVAEKKISGAPDLAVEIASPCTAAYDRLTKYEKYAQAGITEYWIVM